MSAALGDPEHYTEVPWEDRKTGSAFLEYRGNHQRVAEPECYIQRFSLQQEIRRHVRDEGLSKEQAAFVEFFHDRNCQRWVPLRPGRSPEKHLEVYELQEMERRREELALRLADLDR